MALIRRFRLRFSSPPLRYDAFISPTPPRRHLDTPAATIIAPDYA